MMTSLGRWATVGDEEKTMERVFILDPEKASAAPERNSIMDKRLVMNDELLLMVVKGRQLLSATRFLVVVRDLFDRFFLAREAVDRTLLCVGSHNLYPDSLQTNNNDIDYFRCALMFVLALPIFG